MEVNGELQASAALLPGKKSKMSIEEGLGGPQSRSGRFGGEIDYTEINLKYMGCLFCMGVKLDR